MFVFPRPLLLLGDATRLNKKLQVCCLENWSEYPDACTKSAKPGAPRISRSGEPNVSVQLNQVQSNHNIVLCT